MWEESPVGDWTLEVINDGRVSVELKNWSVAFYGTKTHPQPGSKSGSGSSLPISPGVASNEIDTIDIAEPIELNQVPKVPEQQIADVTKLHRGKPLKEEERTLIPEQVSVHMPHCTDPVGNPDRCTSCESGFLLLDGHCVESCPAQGFYVGQENHQESCIQCYYTCNSCNGPNDYQVR